MHETGEVLRVPAALMARAKQEGRRNPKKCRPKSLRKSDRPVVHHGKAQAPKWRKEPTC
jgi:hypothetical protein